MRVVHRGEDTRQDEGDGASVPLRVAFELRDLIMGYMLPRALHAVVRLGVPDLLAAGPRDCDAVAQQLGVHAPTLYRLMRALAGAGVFVEDTPRRFRNSPLSELLRTDVPGSLRGWALMFGHEVTWTSWGAIDHCLRSGEPAFEHVYGAEGFEYFARHPDVAALFDQAMADMAAIAGQAVAETYDFSAVRHLVDVGGGTGTTLCALLHANPHLRGTLFELPHVTLAARARIAAEGLADRCDVATGSFFESAVAGADAYYMQRVLHDWDDEACLRILRCCHEAGRTGARVLVCESVIPPGDEPFYGKITDLNMLVMTRRGRERTLDEYRGLFDAAGFRLTRVVATGAPYSVVEGLKH